MKKHTLEIMVRQTSTNILEKVAGMIDKERENLDLIIEKMSETKKYAEIFGPESYEAEKYLKMQQSKKDMKQLHDWFFDSFTNFDYEILEKATTKELENMAQELAYKYDLARDVETRWSCDFGIR